MLLTFYKREWPKTSTDGHFANLETFWGFYSIGNEVVRQLARKFVYSTVRENSLRPFQGI